MGDDWDDSQCYLQPTEQPQGRFNGRTEHQGGGRGGGRHQRSPRRGGSGQRNGFGERNGGGGGNNFDTLSQAMECLEIYENDIPRVIGRGGSTIQEMERTFRVRIKIDKQTNDNGRKEVKISGREQNDVADAKNKIMDLLGMNERRGGGGGSGGGGSSFYDKKPQNQDEPTFKIIDWNNMDANDDLFVAEKWGHMPPVKKNFYTESEEVSRFSTEFVDKIRLENNKTSVQRNFCDDSERSIPKPVTKFSQVFSNYPEILEQFDKMKFTGPSPIQAQAWPVLLSGEDLIGIAQTGTGKTLAFILPAMIHTEHQETPRSERTGPTVCILAPTRELAIQIQMEVAKFHFRGMRAVCIYGGASRKDQISLIEKGVEIVIATPGRLNDLLENELIDLSSVTYFVLDEADRMLDMGFEPQIQRVLLNIRPDRQTVMTSATWPYGVRQLAKKYMKTPIQVVVGSLDLAAVTSVTQLVEIVREAAKFERIIEFVRAMKPEDKVIIFCGKKIRADDLSAEFAQIGIRCDCIHGQRDQADRERAIADIKSGEVHILIATDVASRGIDIEDITHVVNYDFPKNIEEYVHRVGRTGRAGRKGTAISFFDWSDMRNASELIRILEEANQEVPRQLRRMQERCELSYD